MDVGISKASGPFPVEPDSAAHESADTLEKHFARELHDRVAQRLVGLVLEINELRTGSRDTDSIADELERLEESVRQILRATREMLVDLRGRTDLRLNFVAALKSELTGSSPKVEINVSSRWPKQINGWAAFNLLRIVQQATANASHHGRASTVTVFLDVNTANEAVLVVLDDGAGMNGAPVGHGIMGMQERTTILGGVFNLSPRESGGTRIEVRVPVHRLQ